MGLPPVVPGAEPSVLPLRRPCDDAQLGPGQAPETFEVSLGNGRFRTSRTVGPYLIHGIDPALPGVVHVSMLGDPGVHRDARGDGGVDTAGRPELRDRHG